MGEHSPLPWTTGASGRGVIKDVAGIADGYDHYMIAVTSAHSLVSVHEARANAALIVEAVNSHQAMKDRIEELERDIRHVLPVLNALGGPSPGELEMASKRLSAAIRARGQE